MAGVRPTTIILGADNRKRWSKWDIVLVQAKAILDSERCPDCQLPIYICDSANPDVEFKFVKRTCNLTKAREQYEETEESKRSKRKGAKGKDPKPTWESVQPLPRMRNGADLGSLREPYWEEYHARVQAVLAD